MQPYDVRRFGEVILDPAEQARWCRAVLLGGLPFMWRKAEVARNLIYDRPELRPGDKVLIIGECIEPCGFLDDMRLGRFSSLSAPRAVGRTLLTRRAPPPKDFVPAPIGGAVPRKGDSSCSSTIVTIASNRAR